MHYLSWLNRDDKVPLLKGKQKHGNAFDSTQSNMRKKDNVLIMPITGHIPGRLEGMGTSLHILSVKKFVSNCYV